MNKNYSLTSLISIFLVFPVLAFAAAPVGPNYATWVSDVMGRVVTPVWQLAAGLSVIMFVVAGILFITSNGEPGKITTAKNAVIWGVVGIIVATMAFAIVNVVSSWVTG